MRFAVGVLNFFDNENVVHVVNTNSPEAAIIESVRPSVGEEFADSLEGKTEEEMLTDLFDCDMCVSSPVRV